MPYKRGR